MFWIPNKVSDFLTIIASKSLPVIADLHHFHRTNSVSYTHLTLPTNSLV